MTVTSRTGDVPAAVIDRRSFLKMLGGGVLVCLSPPDVFARQSGGVVGTHDFPAELAAWLHVGADGKITVFTGKAEVGQNIRTSLSQLVAEELRVKPGSVRLVMGDTALTPWDAGTFGSRTTPEMGPQLRRAAAAARGMLLSLAAKRWGVPEGTLIAEGGRVLDRRGGRSAGFGDLTNGEELIGTVDPAMPLVPAAEWRVAGSGQSKVHGRNIVTGRHLYPSDITRPRMLYGKILRPASFGASLVTLKEGEAGRLSGVRVVREGDFVGVTASDQRTAERGARMLSATWQEAPQPSPSGLFDYLKSNSRPDGDAHVVGSLQEGMKSAAVTLEQSYTVQYVAHVPLEPRVAVAEWSGEGLTVWTGTQRPFAVRDELAAFFRLPQENVRVIVPDTGGAYGGKHTGEAAIEAARLAREARRPVRVAWTREEELTWAYFRPAGVIDASSGAGRDGKLLAWKFHNFNSGPAAIRTPYRVPHQEIRFHPSQSPLRQGSYRALAATANNFARETHMDEMAIALGLDPLEFRLRNIGDPRLREVLERGAEAFGWGKRGKGAGIGIACGVEKGGYVATCAEIALTKDSRVRIIRVVQAFDCGAVVNLDGLRNQVEGAIVQGIGGALFERVLFGEGRILNRRLKEYRVPRFSDLPKIDLVLVDRKELPSAGAGETPIIGIAPATGNAIFAATGIRLRGLPLAPDGLPVARDSRER